MVPECDKEKTKSRKISGMDSTFADEFQKCENIPVSMNMSMLMMKLQPK
jgi:hypothetical protein